MPNPKVDDTLPHGEYPDRSAGFFGYPSGTATLEPPYPYGQYPVPDDLGHCSGPFGCPEGVGITATVDPTDGLSFEFVINHPERPHTVHWNFGDGTTADVSSDETVYYTYASPGDYTVTANCHGQVGTTVVTAADTAGPDTVQIRFLAGLGNVSFRFPGIDDDWFTPTPFTPEWDPSFPGPVTGTPSQVVGAAVDSGQGYEMYMDGTTTYPTAADINRWVAEAVEITAVLNMTDYCWYITEPTLTAVMPMVTSLEPASAQVGGPDITLQVFGADFNEDSIIVFNGGDEATTFVSASEVTTVVKPSTASGPAEVPVQVRNGGLLSNGYAFTFTT